MPFNSTDFTSPPWAAGVMTLTHEECIEVKEKCQQIVDDFTPSREFGEPTTFYVVSEYNEIDWTKAINGDTYEALLDYDVDTMTGGIPYNPDNQEEQPTEEPAPAEPPADEPTEEPTQTDPPTDTTTDQPTDGTDESTQGE